MRDLLRAYPALIRAAWARALEYRAQVVLWLLSGIFPLVMLLVWLAVIAEAGPLAGWDQADFISYYVAAALVFQLTGSWVLWDWQDDIRLGNLSFKLLKPLDPLHHFVSDTLGFKLLLIVLILPIFAAAAWLSPSIHYGLTPGRALLFVAALAGGLAVSTFMGSAFAMIAFWSTQSGNLFSLFYGVGQFLSGWIAPLALFPAGFRQAAHWLPFRSLIGFPVEVLLGHLGPAETAFGFAVTAFWAVVFAVIYRLLWHKGLRRYEAVGA
jgi:ABC-2 type transport system permease protein